MIIKIITMLTMSVFAGLVAGAFVNTIDKLGVFDAYDARRASWMPESCKWCAGFWLSIPVIVIVMWDFHMALKVTYIFMPFAAASVAKAINR